MTKKFLFLLNSIFLFFCFFSSDCSENWTLGAGSNNKPPKPLENNSKKEFIQFLYLIQDYSIHAKNLILLLEGHSRKTILEKLNKELDKDNDESFRSIVAKTNELEEQNEDYQKKLAYVKKLAADNSSIKTLKELKKKENDLHVNKLIHLMETLYLFSTTDPEVQENKKLGMKLFLQYHPDKINLSQKSQEKNIEHIILTIISKDITPLLKDNKVNEGLKNLQTQIQNVIIPEPSGIKKTATDATTFLACIGAHIAGYEIITSMVPNKTIETLLYQRCIGSMTGNALKIHNKILNLHTKQ